MRSFEELIKMAKEKHPELDFSMITENKRNIDVVNVICHHKDYAGREHGVFPITVGNLLNGRGCPKCKGKGFTSDDRKLFCEIKYDGKYDYSKSDFSYVKNKTIVTCKEHGDFEIDFDHHFNSNVGCKYCSYPVRDTNTFRKEAEKIHRGFYKYDKSLYIDSHTDVTITCPIHGDFLQSPNAHLRGQGCPRCASSRVVLEEAVEKLLSDNSVPYIRNKRPSWLKTDNDGQMSLDFYLCDLECAIECQGKQHFGIGGWSENFDFDRQYARDKWKKEQCDKNNVELIYFTNKQFAPDSYIGEIFTDKCKLMEKIRYLYNKSRIINSKT